MGLEQKRVGLEKDRIRVRSGQGRVCSGLGLVEVRYFTVLGEIDAHLEGKE